MTSDRIELSATDDSGKFGAYLAALPKTPGPGVVMLQEILGITPWIHEIANQFSVRGYCVAFPDIFWRLKPDFVADYRIPQQRERGLQLRSEINHEKAIDDIAAMIEHLKALPECNGKIAVVGFCMGGTLAYLSAARLKPDAAIVYYGTEVHRFLDEGLNINCPTIFHAGVHDQHVPLDLLNTIKGALEDLPSVVFHLYDADHAFANTHRPELFQAAPTERAHELSFKLLDTLF